MNNNKDTTEKLQFDMKYEDLLEKAKIDLQAALHQLRIQEPFVGATLQTLEIMFSMEIPTAGVTINPEAAEWLLVINPAFFTINLNDIQKRAVLIHELYHIVNGHLARIPFQTMGKNEKEKERWNIAADLAINQFIKGLPEWALSLDKVLFQGQPLPPNKATEEYYTMLDDEMERREEQKKENENGEGGMCDQDCANCPLQNGQAQPGNGVGSKQCRHGGMVGSHDGWEKANEMGEMESLKATEKLIQRTLQKENFGYDKLPQSIKDFLSYAAVRKAEINYKSLIGRAIRRSLSGDDIDFSWKRPNRKYGELAKGRVDGEVPFLHIYIDTSGSISIEEANEFLGIVNGFCKVLDNECMVHMFNTKIYASRIFKDKSKVKEGDFESGGTELTPVMQRIAKTSPDLSIILTDGYYDNVPFESMVKVGFKFPTTCFVITKQGDENHPLKRLGTTIKIPKRG